MGTWKDDLKKCTDGFMKMRQELACAACDAKAAVFYKKGDSDVEVSVSDASFTDFLTDCFNMSNGYQAYIQKALTDATDYMNRVKGTTSKALKFAASMPEAFSENCVAQSDKKRVLQ